MQINIMSQYENYDGIIIEILPVFLFFIFFMCYNHVVTIATGDEKK
tara:strand:- start:1248 stop:1385 length:138 start_codon:yes stop_codon:yes gene_type:complete